MTFRTYSFFIAVASILAWIAWIIICTSTDPINASRLQFFFFYLSLACALIGTLSLFGTMIRLWRYKDVLISRHVTRSLRQAILLTCIVITSLILLAKNVFSFGSMFALIFSISLIEYLFLTSSTKRSS